MRYVSRLLEGKIFVGQCTYSHATSISIVHRVLLLSAYFIRCCMLLFTSFPFIAVSNLPFMPALSCFITTG